jgi:SAM-dependent methyltransferase
MEPREYELMAGLEDGMWWYRAAHANLMLALGRPPATANPLLDAGCGTGGFLRRLGQARPDLTAVGLDISGQALALARTRVDARLCAGSVNALPFADDSFAAVTSIDVLCHRAVEPLKALSEAFRCLVPGGRLVLNLPAYAWLASAHDLRVHNDRRFTRGEAVALVEAAGFTVARASYWNMLLLPLMVLRRKIFAGLAGSESDVKPYPPVIDRLFFTLTAIERWWLKAGGSLPCGGSILILAVKS